MLDPEKARLNELKFYEFCSRLGKIRNNPKDTADFITFLRRYKAFDLDTLINLSIKILMVQYKPKLGEIVFLKQDRYISTKQIADLLECTERNVNIKLQNLKEKGYTLTPRLTKDEQIALNQFMEAMKGIIYPDYTTLILEEEL